MFQFKQFSILQDQSAMKVGTDGVLLGAWTPVNNCQSALDIGTGTGLIALMLAQRNQSINIDALEIDKDAFLEANFNFGNSRWSDRLNLYHTSLENFKSSKKYELIVSNPPYYTDTHKSEKSKRTLARHVDGLTFEKLLKYANNLLLDNGMCSFIIPYKEETNFLKIANELDLFPKQITRVKGRGDLPFKRSMILLAKSVKECVYDELVIEIDRHIYTNTYINLTKDFYLKM